MALQARDLMVKANMAVRDDTPIFEMTRILRNLRIAGLPVIDAKKKFIGIVTVADIFHAMETVRGMFRGKALWVSLFLSNRKLIRVKDIYYREFIHVLPETLAEDIVDIMLRRNLQAVPVTNKEQTELYGMVGRYELTWALFSPTEEVDDNQYLRRYPLPKKQPNSDD